MSERGRTTVRRVAEVGAEGGELSTATEEAIRSARQGGTPLDAGTRTGMEDAFGADLSRVRLHTGREATELNEKVQAKAFTVGSDIFLRGARPDLQSRDGQTLLAHELTHTIQQGVAEKRTGPAAAGGETVGRQISTAPLRSRSGAAPSKDVVRRNGGGKTGALPTIGHLAPMEQTLMTGVLEKKTVDRAVLQIYENARDLTGWTYNASVAESEGRKYTQEGESVGMCESYRNAFHAALVCYDTLRKTHPVDAVKNGALVIEPDDSLASVRFCTVTGLTLMGPNNVKGNVYREVDGRGNETASGLGTINKFVFSGHWTLKVNGVVYDPIFYSIDGNNVALVLDRSYMSGGGRFVPDVGKPIPSGEFGATFIWVSEWDPFLQTVDSCKELYEAHKEDVDAILDGTKGIKGGGLLKPKRPCYTKAKKLVGKAVDDPQIFGQVVADSGQFLSGSKITAVDKILALAAMT
ncbi:MAG: DUF4157 domain-containing protein [Acidimicrobiales bacterium]